MIRRTTCLLCGRELTPIAGSLGYQAHADVEDCLVRLTDAWGVAIEEMTSDGPLVITRVTDDEGAIDLNPYPTVDEALVEFFGKRGLRRLGGVSSGRGWSSFSLFQRCPYAWKRRYIDKAEPRAFMRLEAPALAVGSLVHMFLALYYENMIGESPYTGITPEIAFEEIARIANPEFVVEAWRVFRAYALYYQGEEIYPLAIEHDLRDPRTGESCRFDLIAHFPYAHGDRAAGTYNIEHKTSGRFDEPTLDGWANDGEVLGQVALWDLLKLEKRFGPMKATIVNILGKQKEPKFHRTFVAPESWQIEQHLDDLKKWEGHIQMARATGLYPRSRANCIGRYGKCEHWSHCAGVDY